MATNKTTKPPTSKSTVTQVQQQPKFQVYDETEDKKATGSSYQRKPPQSSRSVEDDIVARTSALNIRTHDASGSHFSATSQSSPREAPLPSPACSSSAEQDAMVLHNMIDLVFIFAVELMLKLLK